MTRTPDQRASYLASTGIHPASIPGRACLRGDWDGALGMARQIASTTTNDESGDRN